MPSGATYANLQAVAKANPNYYFNVLSSRRGRKAAQRCLLPVLTSRVGLPVLAKVEYDDAGAFGLGRAQPQCRGTSP